MKKTRHTPFLVGASAWLCVAFLSACQSAPTPTDADLLQGYWEGKDERREYSMTFSGKSLFYYAGEDFWYETEFTLPAGTDPRQLHATIIRDSTGSEDGVGTVVMAIFKVEAGTLTMVTSESGGLADSFDSERVDRYDLERAPPREGRTRPPTND